MLTHGVGPTDVARAVGVTEKTVRRWTQGKPLTNRVRLALAVYFKMAPEALPVGLNTTAPSGATREGA